MLYNVCIDVKIKENIMRGFKCLICCFVVYLSTFLVINVEAKESNQLNVNSVQETIDEVINRQLVENNIPGATISIVHNQDIIYKRGYGYSDLKDELSVNPNETLFRIGSISKLFTWTAVMQLVEQGKLDLNEDINTYLDFEIPNQIYNSSIKPQPITLYHLMTHTSGFEDIKKDLAFINPSLMPTLKEYIYTNLPNRIFHPGEVVAYSNYGAALAGYIIELVSKQTFHEYIEKYIYTPLQMQHSSFEQPLPHSLMNNIAHASKFIDGKYIEDDFIYLLQPAGAMSTTSDDLARFMIAHLNKGNYQNQSILQLETIEKMHQTQFSHHSLLDGMTLGFVEYEVNGYRVLFHGGDSFSFNSWLYLVPELNLGLFVSYSGSNYKMGPELFQQVMDAIDPSNIDHVIGSPTKESNNRIYMGEYFPNQRNLTTDERLLVLNQSMIVKQDENGFLVVNYLGEKRSFIEIGSGIYQSITNEPSISPYGALNRLVFEKDDSGTMFLYTDGKMSYSKAAWYETSTVTILSIVISIVIILISILLWYFQITIKLIKRQPLKGMKLEKVVHRLALLFGTLLVMMLALILSTIVDFHPLYQQPLSAFGDNTKWFPLIEKLGYILIILSGLLLVSTMFLWFKKVCRIRILIHYSIYTVASVLLILVLNYWNLI